MPGCQSAEQATLASIAGLRLLLILAFVTYASLLCSPTHPLPFLCNLPTSSTFFTMWYPVCFLLLGLIILPASSLINRCPRTLIREDLYQKLAVLIALSTEGTSYNATEKDICNLLLRPGQQSQLSPTSDPQAQMATRVPPGSPALHHYLVSAIQPLRLR